MRHPISLLIFLLVVFILNSNIAKADTQFSISANLLHFDYEEYDDAGISLDRETGFIPGISFSLINTQNIFGFQLFGGTVNYDGHTQLGAPHETSTEETIYRFNYRRTLLDATVPNNTDYYLDINYQIWDRNILPNNGISGLYEQYRWWSAELGLISTLSQHNNDTLNFELGLSYHFNGSIQIDLEPFNSGEPVLNLGRRPGLRAALVYQKILSSTQTLAFTLEHRHWEFGKSNQETITTGDFAGATILEPESRSDHTLFSLTLSSFF